MAPWTPAEFKSRHNHGLSPAQAAHAAHQGNALLRAGVPEGEAIAIANGYEKRHRDAGGQMPDPSQGGIGGITPSSQSQNPFMQSLIGHYANQSVEKLQELAGITGNSPQGQIIGDILKQKMIMPHAGQQMGGQQSSDGSQTQTKRLPTSSACA